MGDRGRACRFVDVWSVFNLTRQPAFRRSEVRLDDFVGDLSALLPKRALCAWPPERGLRASERPAEDERLAVAFLTGCSLATLTHSLARLLSPSEVQVYADMVGRILREAEQTFGVSGLRLTAPTFFSRISADSRPEAAAFTSSTRS